MFSDILFILENQIDKKTKGDFLEKTTSHIINKYGYDVVEQVRLTGMEIDVIGKHKLNKNKVFVECKFHKEPISAPDIDKLIGKCTRRKIKDAIFVYTSTLGKEAKGVRMEIEDDESPIVSVTFWGKKEILDGLKDAYQSLVSKLQNEFCADILESAVFCLRENGNPFFLIEESNDENTSKLQILNLDYNDNEKEKIENLLIKQPKFDGKRISFYKKNVLQMKEEQQIADIVVPIISEYTIDDYAPSNPDNFIGRSKLLAEFIEFFESVKLNETKTRIICLEGPTGYGKSSFLLKLIDKTKFNNDLFLYAVDCRSANTGQFVSLSLKKVINASIKSTFLPKSFDKRVVINSTEYLSSKYMNKLTEYLEKKNKVIIIFFDQFEEILTKNRLNPVFVNLQQLFNEIMANEVNIVIGFSWREHIYFQETNEAYHLFRNTEDKRKTFKISGFKQKDVSGLIKLFEKKKKRKITNPIKRRIEMQAQGLPWWSKKLCIHIFSELEQTGHHELLASNLNIKTLFDNDLNKLSEKERSCLRFIAKNSPISSPDILEHFENKSITELQNQRQIIKVGSNFTIYWDVFKEYLLSNHVPIIPFASIPQCEIKMLLKTLSVFGTNRKITKKQISINTKYSTKTVQNIIADLLTLDIIEGDKSKYILVNSQISDEHISAHLKNILIQHTVVINLIKELKENINISISTIETLIKASNPSVILDKKTVSTYAKRFVRYLIFSGILKEEGNCYLQNNDGIVNFTPFYSTTKKGIGILAGSPKKAYSICLKLLNQGEFNRNEGKMRNTILDLITLGLINQSRDIVKPSLKFSKLIKNEHLIKSVVKDFLLENEYLKSIAKLYLNGTIVNNDIYMQIKSEFSLNWSNSSIKRNINTAKRWLIYYGIINNKSKSK
jgi:restriction endonuclease/putative ATPase